MREIGVGTNEAGQRMDKLLRKVFRNGGDGFLYKMLRKKNILLNGHKATGKERLQEGDVITCYLSEETFAAMTGETAAERLNPDASSRSRPSTLSSPCSNRRDPSCDLAERILYEDRHLLLLDKPAGWLSQGDGRGIPSANERCLEYLLQKGELSPEQLATFRPGVANRLDRNTSGILIFGKTLPALQEVSSLLRDHRLAKEYLAAVEGRVSEGLRIEGYLHKDPSRNRAKVAKEPFPGGVRIETAFDPVYAAEGDPGAYTILKVRIYTGKPHQIRAQLAALGHPILGDPKYGDARRNRVWKEKFGVTCQLLHAWRLGFPAGLSGVLSPLSGQTVLADPPEYFRQFLPEGLLEADPPPSQLPPCHSRCSHHCGS